MVNNDIFYAFLVSNLEIKFLKKEEQTNESGLVILLIMRYLSAEWSVKMVVLDPSRQGQNFSKANTTAKNSFSVVV